MIFQGVFQIRRDASSATFASENLANVFVNKEGKDGSYAMENKFGNDVKQYKNVLVRGSSIGDKAILTDNVFISDSSLGQYCLIERRGVIIHLTIRDYSYTGYNTVV